MIDDCELEAEYHYDIGYYEGVRNTLHIFLKGFTHINHSTDTSEAKVDFVLEEIRKELDDAIASQKSSEKRFFDTKEQY